MPKTEIDYSNTIIYKITCKIKEITDVYVGHTTNFVQRKHAHKQSCKNNKSTNHNCKLYEVIRKNGGWDNWNMEIINFFNCVDHYEARKKEQEYFISLNATLNSIEPFPKPKVAINNIIPVSDIEHISCEKVSAKFNCNNCDYHTSRKSSIDKHLLSNKHKKRTMRMVHNPTNYPDQIYKCKNCNKPYKARNSLWYHEQKCILNKPQEFVLQEDNKTSISKLVIETINNNKILQQQIIDILKLQFS